MRKIIIILILIISSIPLIIKKNDYRDITNIININSIGFNYNNESKKYEIYFYIINNFNITNSKIASSNINNLSYLIKVENIDFYNAFNSLFSKVNEYISFSHLKTVILTKNFITPNNLNLFFGLIKNNSKFYYNFYIFTTNSSLNEIYNIKNFSDVSAYHTILTTPNLMNSYKLITYNKFANIILVKNYSLFIPNIIINKNVINSDSKNLNSIEINGYNYFRDKQLIKTFITNDNSCNKWLMNLNNQTIKIDNYNVLIKTLKTKIIKRKNLLTIKYKISSILVSNMENYDLTTIEDILSKLIYDEINTLYNSNIIDNIDIYNLKFLYPECNNIKIVVNFNLN